MNVHSIEVSEENTVKYLIIITILANKCTQFY